MDKHIKMNKIPRLKIQRSAFEWGIDLLGFAVLLFSWAYLILNYDKLPETIATHYNAAGEANGFGHKKNLFTVLFIGQLLYTGIFIMNFFPHLFNYLKEITPKNALEQYTAATKLLRTINIVIAFLFSYLSVKGVHNALNEQQDLEGWVLPVLLCLIFAPLVYYIAKFAKK